MSAEYDSFMKKYRKEHKCCPKCGSTAHTTTLASYILDMTNKDRYKDLNNCECYECGDRHTAHERVPLDATCMLCTDEVRWIRHTQFAGSHPYCDKHARDQKDFGSEDSYWEELEDEEEEEE